MLERSLHLLLKGLAEKHLVFFIETPFSGHFSLLGGLRLGAFKVLHLF